MHADSIKHKKIETPVGALLLMADDTHLLAALWEEDVEKDHLNPDKNREEKHHALLCETEKQLREYFLKQRTAFHLPLRFTGTDFQNRVWNELLHIPYGTTKTYLHIAQALGNRHATRAVGLANGKNPLSIIVPCHRVIGTNGKLTGYAGGLDKKSFLLELEQPYPTPCLF